MKIIGAGLGRTGTMSLKLALEQLGFGPCYHMEAVFNDLEKRVPQWNGALAGKPDWEEIFDGFSSSVDWPTAGFYEELYTAYPDAKYILSTRSPESWAASFGGTIAKLIEDRENAPPHMQPWLEMAHGVIARTGFPDGLTDAELIERFEAHNEAVKQTIPADQLLVFEVRQGWGPLCDFLGVEAPDEPFPRTNNRAEFWDLVTGQN
ncbi:sulfotransferase family protein [Henriciella sp.]|uniref:sulfotransferase family protein n=1 Tax=Henriciella sp. TaxID=1968823 RepID=UPI00261B8997|nr:sulfotransferase family protein [Henriciella sp.]